MHLGSIWETSGRHLGGIREASGRLLGGIWEASGRHVGLQAALGLQEAPNQQKTTPLSAKKQKFQQNANFTLCF